MIAATPIFSKHDEGRFPPRRAIWETEVFEELVLFRVRCAPSGGRAAGIMPAALHVA